jgi:hypothetical protein
VGVRGGDRERLDQLIAAAQLFRYLSANCSRRKPEHENQLRPLVGLTGEQAQKAWERAAEKASGRKTTAQMVKSAVKELHLAGTANPVSRQPRQNKDQQRLGMPRQPLSQPEPTATTQVSLPPSSLSSLPSVKSRFVNGG